MNYLKRIKSTMQAILVLALALPTYQIGTAQVTLVNSRCIKNPISNMLDIELLFEIDPDIYIQSHVPSNEILIPTTFTVNSCSGLEIDNIEFLGEKHKSDIELDISIFSDSFSIMIHAIEAEGPPIMSADLRFQAYNATKSFFPKTYPIDLGWKVQELVAYAYDKDKILDQ